MPWRIRLLTHAPFVARERATEAPLAVEVGPVLPLRPLGVALAHPGRPWRRARAGPEWGGRVQ
eukprot:3960447-Pyramimonas_sp.AAC.1